MMKRFIYFLLTIGIWAFLLASCTDEELIKQQNVEVIEGVPVIVKLNYAAAQSAVQTRTAQSEERQRGRKKRI